MMKSNRKKVLLIEPNYANKYPPIGLMKISTYYKNLGGWDVTFFKGDLKQFVIDAWNGGYLAGFNKANEWHKTSEKLPKDCSLVLAYGFDDTEPTLYYYVASDTWEWMPKRIAVYSNDQIRLWKEIILPKESEQKCITKFYFMSFL